MMICKYSDKYNDIWNDRVPVYGGSLWLKKM